MTTLIAGLALLAFGTGPVRGFAVVLYVGHSDQHVLGRVLLRGLVNLCMDAEETQEWAIGQVWKSRAKTTARGWPQAALIKKEDRPCEFFRIKKDIPSERSTQLVLNAVSFITSALAVFFLVTQNLSVGGIPTGGTVMEAGLPQTADTDNAQGLALPPTWWCRTGRPA